MFKRIIPLFVFLVVFISCFATSKVPGKIIDYVNSTTPVVLLESLPIESYSILREFDVQKHIPHVHRDTFSDYFLNRNRVVFLTPDKIWVVKIWGEDYPSAPLFWEAFQAGLYDNISKSIYRLLLLHQQY